MVKIGLSIVMLIAISFVLYLYYGRVQVIDPSLQRRVEANIPECAERDRAGDAIRKRMKDENRTYYYGTELDDYDRKAKACFDKFAKAMHEK